MRRSRATRERPSWAQRLSPTLHLDGGEKLNNTLSEKRSKSADKAWDKVMKGKDVADPEVKSIGQDWEGFQELVQNSDIEDKDLILRVLSMYSDPSVRESEIKNMSSVLHRA